MMISIALTGGSPGARPKPKTSTSVPTPPQSPRPTPPERTPRAMKPITTSPSSAIRIQSEVLTGSSPHGAAGSARVERRAGELGIEPVTSATVCTPPASTVPIARAASVSCSIACSRQSASSSSESCASSSSFCAERPSRRAAWRPPHPAPNRACRRRRRHRRWCSSPRWPARGPRERIPFVSPESGIAALRCPPLLSVRWDPAHR